MELRQLRYFSEVVRQGSYRRAAARLNLTQPALSKSIRALEMELGVRLLERGMHGVSPTPFGSVLVEGADLVGRDLNRTIEKIHRLNHGASGGTVRIGGMTTLMRWILPPVAKNLARVSPTARIDVQIALVDDLLVMLETDRIDLAIGTVIPDSTAIDLSRERLLVDSVRVVCDRGHPLLNGPGGKDTRHDLASVARYRWVIPGESDIWRQQLCRVFREVGLKGPSIAIETGSSALMAGVVAGTDYLSLLPNRILDSDPVFAHLAAADIEIDWPDFEVVLAYRSQAARLPATVACIRAIRQIAEKSAAE